MKLAARIGILLSFALSATGASAATVVSFDNGWYDDLGQHFPDNINTFTGENSSRRLNSFYAFDLTGQSAASAITITFFANGDFVTDTGSETVGLYDFTGSLDALLNGTGDIAAFADLGSGIQLGQHTLTGRISSFDTPMPEFTVALDSSFVSQFNAALASSDKRIALGASLLTLTPDGGGEALWSYSERLPAARLNITTAAAVPEPATWAMMLFGLGFIGAAIRKKKPATYHGIRIA